MRRRLLLLVLLGSLLGAGAAAAVAARGQARLVEDDLAVTRSLLARAGGFQAGRLEQRQALIDQAEASAANAEARLGRWPLRQLGAVPLLGRDVRVARAVAASATSTVEGTRRLVTALQPVQTRPPTRATILAASNAFL
ncbi:MAG TPA: hypothetical protein VGR68_01610, partial [Actinomycetota bacterium]|nr:hypothetical protein [Actinomycetota bacterium]